LAGELGNRRTWAAQSLEPARAEAEVGGAEDSASDAEDSGGVVAGTSASRGVGGRRRGLGWRAGQPRNSAERRGGLRRRGAWVPVSLPSGPMAKLCTRAADESHRHSLARPMPFLLLPGRLERMPQAAEGGAMRASSNPFSRGLDRRAIRLLELFFDPATSC